MNNERVRPAGLLRDTSVVASEVAHKVGYDSEETFSRAFKRAMGKPPAQWRRHAVAPEQDELLKLPASNSPSRPVNLLKENICADTLWCGTLVRAWKHA